MGEFIEVITSFPTVLFTVLTGLGVIWWCLAAVVGAGDELDLLPLGLRVTLASLTAWLVSALASIVIGDLVDLSGAPGVLVGSAVAASAAAAGIVVAGRTAGLLAPVLSPAPSLRRGDLVGRICTVRTGRVDGDFGQAEVVDAEGGTQLIQIRCPEANRLGAGDRALVVLVEDDVFVVSADLGGIEL